MQDKYNDFDLQIRSMLEDAEVKPSRRAWRGISSRLDAAAATGTAAYAAWAKWAGAALACAAVAVGVFFLGTGNQTDYIFESPSRLVSTSSPEIVEFIPAPSRLKDLSAQRLDRDVFEISEVTGDESVVIMEEAEAAKDTAPAKTAGRKKVSRTTEEVADPFAIMAAEDSKGRFRAGRTALYAKGAVGGNDSDIRITSGSASMAPGKGGAGFTEESSSTYGVPFTVGLGVRVYVSPKISLGTGLDYSLLTRSFMGKYSNGSISEAGTVTHSVQYLGIPLDVYYDIISTDKLKFYVYGGGEAEYCISNKYTLHSSPDIVGTTPVKKLQWSVGTGVGVEFRLSRLLGLYIDPSLRYYFPGDQPKSIRTDKPVIVNFDAGLRFNF